MRSMGWWLFLAACSGGGRGGTGAGDAAVLDGVVIDSAFMDAPAPGDVDVTTYVRCCALPPLTAQAGVTVVAIQLNGGSVVGMSDTTGHVVLHDVEAGATVYAGYPETADTATTTLVTMFYVMPGDHLVFGEKYTGAWDAHGTAGTWTVNLPPYAGADNVRVSSGCSSISGVSPISVPIAARCQTPTATVASIAYNGSTPLATAYATNVPYTPGTTYDAGPWIPSSELAVSISGLVGIDSNVDLYVSSIGSTFVDGTFGRQIPTNGSITAALTAPRSAPAIYVYATPEEWPAQTGRHDFYAKLAPTATTAQLVYPDLPWVDEVNPSTQTVYWTQTPGSYDAASVSLSWARFDPDSTRHDFVWSVILPSGVTSFPKYPSLPAELAPFAIRPTDEAHYPPLLTLADFAEATGYDGARALPEWALAFPYIAAAVGDVEGVAVAHNYAP